MPAQQAFPALDAIAIQPTRDALHAYSRLLGDWLKSARPKRKHWWHASLRPSLRGLTTGVVRVGEAVDVEIELDFVASELRVRTVANSYSEALRGQSAAQLAAWLAQTLQAIGVEAAAAWDKADEQAFSGYAAEQAASLQLALGSVAAALSEFRAGIREETSPVQLWPHHFDLSMIWLPGAKIAGQDPANEEYADKQMNFGFAFGDDGIAEPYFYVTAYPLPDAMPLTPLPQGTVWKSDGFSGAVLLYRDLVAMDNPTAYLHDVWSMLLAAGLSDMTSTDE